MVNWKKLQTDEAFRKRMKKRSEIVFGVRNFFRDRDFLEVETPIMVAYPDTEPTIDPFGTELIKNDGSKHRAHLITSPEYSCKKLLAAGYERIFEVARCFRNGELWGGTHNPEFTMVEWYRANQDYRAVMEDTEHLVQYLANKMFGKTEFIYQGKKLDVSPPWPRITVLEAFQKFADIDLEPLLNDANKFRSVARNRGDEVQDSDTFDDIFFRIFLKDIEPKLGQNKPTFLCDYPSHMAALSRVKPDDSRLAERFEAYALGIELCNAFTELTDAEEQRRRVDKDRRTRTELGKDELAIDEQFLEAVSQMPDSTGISLGIDRLVMLLTDAPTIEDVLFFPATDLFE